MQAGRPKRRGVTKRPQGATTQKTSALSKSNDLVDTDESDNNTGGGEEEKSNGGASPSNYTKERGKKEGGKGSNGGGNEEGKIGASGAIGGNEEGGNKSETSEVDVDRTNSKYGVEDRRQVADSQIVNYCVGK